MLNLYKILYMKHPLLLSILLLSITIATAQYQDIERTKIEKSQVPEAVTDAQQRQFREGFVTQWKLHLQNNKYQDDVTYYMAKFKKGGAHGNYAYYSTEGELLAYSLFKNGFDLPESIQDYCFTNFRDTKIKSAEFIDLENPKQFIYRVRLNQQGQLQYLYFSNDGQLIEKERLPAKIFLFI